MQPPSEQPQNPQSLQIKELSRGFFAALPLSIAVIPWGILAGSFAVDAGFDLWQAQAMSAILFAGSAQLVATGMLKAGLGLGSLLLTILFITSRHILYSVSMREKIRHLPLRWRLLLGFWLTDELFALCNHQSKAQFNRWYAFAAGGSFYLIWNLASFIGIIAGSQLPALNTLGLDFAVAAIFIALVLPAVKHFPGLLCVLVTLVVSVVLTVNRITGALMIAALAGMLAGFFSEAYGQKRAAKKSNTAQPQKQWEQTP